MEIEHIILGRPWQFDRYTLHEGHSIIITFHFQGHKYTLYPQNSNKNRK